MNTRQEEQKGEGGDTLFKILQLLNDEVNKPSSMYQGVWVLHYAEEVGNRGELSLVRTRRASLTTGSAREC